MHTCSLLLGKWVWHGQFSIWVPLHRVQAISNSAYTWPAGQLVWSWVWRSWLAHRPKVTFSHRSFFLNSLSFGSEAGKKDIFVGLSQTSTIVLKVKFWTELVYSLIGPFANLFDNRMSPLKKAIHTFNHYKGSAYENTFHFPNWACYQHNLWHRKAWLLGIILSIDIIIIFTHNPWSVGMCVHVCVQCVWLDISLVIHDPHWSERFIPPSIHWINNPLCARHFLGTVEAVGSSWP